MKLTLEGNLLALVFAAVSGGFLVPQELPAPEAAGQWRGLVTNTSGAAIAGASVTALCTATGRSHQVRSDRNGRYELGGLPPCAYRLEVKADGFEPLMRERRLEPGATATENVVLTPVSGWASIGAAAGWFLLLLAVVAAVFGLYLTYRWWKRRTKEQGKSEGQVSVPTPPSGEVVAPRAAPAVDSGEVGPMLGQIAGELPQIRQQLEAVASALNRFANALPEMSGAVRELAGAGRRQEAETEGMELESVTVTRVLRAKGDKGGPAAGRTLTTEERLMKAFRDGVQALQNLGARPVQVGNIQAMKMDSYLEPVYIEIQGPGPGDLYLLEAPGQPQRGWLVPRPQATATDCGSRFTGIPGAFEVRDRTAGRGFGRVQLVRPAQVARNRDGWAIVGKGELELS